MKTPSERRAALLRLVEARTVTRVAPPMLLPAGPYFDLAGEEFGSKLFLTTATTGAELCLRPDFTLPVVKSYIEGEGFGAPAAFTYLGPIFRQGESGPEEHEQAGIELLGQANADQALDQVLTFARWALSIYGIDEPRVRLGGVGLFESLLAMADLTPTWRARIRHRFGHPDAMERLLDRLEHPAAAGDGQEEPDRQATIERVTEAMLAGGFSLGGSRLPEEVADRYIEKQAIAAARVPQTTVRLLRAYLEITDLVPRALERIAVLTRSFGLDFDRPLQIVRSHASALQAVSPRAEVILDASFSPRLDYYTGIVFEMTGRAGRVLASGGEYDRLLERLGATQKVAASGCALWVDRLEAEALR